MNELTKKLLVVGIGCALTGGIILYRVRSMRTGTHDHPHFDALVEKLASPPAGVRGLTVPYCLARNDRARLALLKLGTITYFHDAEELMANGPCTVPQDVRDAQIALEGNAYLQHSVEVDVADKPKGTGKQLSDVYVAHTGPLPAAVGATVGAKWDVVANVFAGKIADGAGMQVGDVILSVNGNSAAGGGVTNTTLALPIGSEVKLGVSRDGRDVLLTMTKSDAILGYQTMTLPYLGL